MAGHQPAGSWHGPVLAGVGHAGAELWVLACMQQGMLVAL